MYRQLKAGLGDERPPGLVVHLVVKTDGGLRHTEVWESREDWERFRDEKVQPAVDKMLTAAGVDPLPPQPQSQDLELVDVLVGA
jgi:hypothetical protein